MEIACMGSGGIELALKALANWSNNVLWLGLEQRFSPMAISTSWSSEANRLP